MCPVFLLPVYPVCTTLFPSPIGRGMPWRSLGWVRASPPSTKTLRLALFQDTVVPFRAEDSKCWRPTAGSDSGGNDDIRGTQGHQ